MRKVKSIETWFVSEFTDEKGILHAIEQRDESGNITQECIYDTQGELEKKIERAFNSEGKLLEEKQYTSESAPDQVFHYEYAESGRLKQITIAYQDGSFTYKKYAFDPAEKTESILILDEENYEEGKEFRRYDNEGRVLEETIHIDGELDYSLKTSYDDAGYEVERSVVKPDEEVQYFYEYERDEEGRISALEVYNGDDETLREEEVSYDDKGRRTTHKVKDHMSGYFSLEKWEYDEGDREKSYQRFGASQNLMEEITNTYTEENLLKDQEVRNAQGLYLRYYKYEFY